MIFIIVQMCLLTFLVAKIVSRNRNTTKKNPVKHFVRYLQLQDIKRRKKQKRILTLYRLLKQRSRSNEKANSIVPTIFSFRTSQ